MGWDAVQRRVVGGAEDTVGFLELAEVDKGGGEREQRLGMAGIGRDPGAVAGGIAQQPERLADLAVVPGDDRAGGQGRHDGMAVMLAGVGKDGVGQGPSDSVARPGPGQQVRGQRLLAQAVRQLRLGQDHLGLAGGVAGRAAGAQDRGQGAPQPGLGNRRQRPGQGVLGEPGGLVQPAGRGQGLGGGHRAGQRAGVGRGCQLQRAQRQVGRGLRRRTQCLHRRGVKIGQRRRVARDARPAAGDRRPALRVSPRLSRIWPYWRCSAWRAGRGIMSATARRSSSCRNENALSAAVMIPVSIASSTVGSSPAGRFAQHLRRVLQPERRAEHRRGHQQVPGPLAEAIKPPLRDTVHPPRQPGGNQDGAAAGDPDGFIVAQAADQLGEQCGVAGGTASQGQQRLVRRRAERVGEQRRHRVIIERPQGDTGGAILLQEVEEVFRVMLRCAGPGQKPGDRVVFQFQRQRPQGCQGGRACPLQVIQAHQDRSRPSPLFQMRTHLADPPPGRV